MPMPIDSTNKVVLTTVSAELEGWDTLTREARITRGTIVRGAIITSLASYFLSPSLSNVISAHSYLTCHMWDLIRSNATSVHDSLTAK